MTTRIVLSVLMAALLAGVPAFAQAPPRAPLRERYVDPVDGLTVDQAIARALEQEPSLRAARTEIEVARGTQVQASAGPNPTVSFEHRVEPGGTDNLTTIAMEWPLNLFRKDRRAAAADREVTAVQLAVADRERLLAAEVRTRYGDVVAAVRDAAIFDELVSTAGRQHGLLRSRVEEGATPPLERDLVDVDLRRLQSDRLLQAGRTEAALFELKRLLGLEPEAQLRVRDTLEALVRRELSASPPSGDTTLVDQRADVREAAARVDVADARIEQVQSEGRFDVTLFGNYMRMDAGFPQLGFGPNGGLERVRGLFQYVSAGASVSLPLNRNQGDVAAATAGRAGAGAALDAVRLAARSELAVARARDDRAQQAVNVYSSGAQALARQNLAVVSQSYDLGRVTVFDVLTEQRRYLEVERAYTEALKAAYEARTALRLALGGVQ
jgi:outer membrane protein, heavy metal efflux system